MLKRIGILSAWVLIWAGIMAGQPNQTPSDKQGNTASSNTAIAAPHANAVAGKGEQDQAKPGNDSPSGNATFKWPTWMHDSNWWLVIAAALTGCVICWQSIETRKAARGAEKAANAALLNAQAFINAERPWILVKEETSKRWKGGHQVVAVNKGRTPAVLISHAEKALVLEAVEFPPDIAQYGEIQIYPAPQIILPDESMVICDVTEYSLHGRNQAEIIKFRNVETLGYLFGTITYRDLLGPPAAQTHETRWCFSIMTHGEQELMLMEWGWGGDEYMRHT